MASTTTDLTTTLADALGLPRRLVDETARHLREADMLPDGDTPATVEHAVTLLIGLMAAPMPADAPDRVRLYSTLPFDSVTGAMQTPSLIAEMFSATDTAIITDVDDLGETFGAFLVSLVRLSNGPAAPVFDLGDIFVGGGLGTANAGVLLSRVDGDAPVLGVVKFSMAPFGADRLPDDAAVARLDSSETVPGTIFGVLRAFFTADTSHPREATLAHAGASGL